MYFLSGLPRSGSTVLANILNQNPQLSCTGTSGLIDTMGAMVASWESNPSTKANKETQEDLFALLKAVVDKRIPQDKILIDKSRGWPAPSIMNTMSKVLGKPVKIIATVRPIPDCVASFVRVCKPTDVKHFCNNDKILDHLKSSYNTLKQGFAAYPESILFVEYDDLVTSPQRELDRIYDFLELPRFFHDFNDIKNTVQEDDTAWGVPDLHTTRPVLEKKSSSAREILGERLFTFYNNGQFWSGKEDTPAPQILDVALDASLHGNFSYAEALIDLALQNDPDDVRAQFNKGWYILYHGELTKGTKILDVGRQENLFGPNCTSSQPRWNGENLRGKTLMMHLQGGLGDQIIGVRFAKNFKDLGAKVICAGSPSLATILVKCDGVSAFIDSKVIGGVFHDYWIDALYSPAPLNLEFKDLSGKPYIAAKKHKRGKQLRIGLRWEGNSEFEHEQHRRFDPTPLFNLKGVTLVNLQRDSDSKIPDHLELPSLSTWEDTKKAIESCDLIISSCTSVAHMSAAMGKPTWIIVPILPYYLWAVPGETTAWYDSVRLFRQTEFGNWDKPMEKIKSLLNKHERII